MPSFNTACPPPRKAKTAPGPKSRNVVDVEKLKESNFNQEPGVDKKNVKFLYGLLEEASNERQLLLKQLAEKDEKIEMISQQRKLEETSFRKVLTAERKKFDKKILDAHEMLRRREDILRQWCEAGIASEKANDKDSEDWGKINLLLKRTCKIIPDLIDDSLKKELNIETMDLDNNNDEERDEIFVEENEIEDNDEHLPERDTASGSILMAGFDEKRKSTDMNKDPSGNICPDDVAGGTKYANIVTSMSIGEMVASSGKKQVIDEANFESLQFQTLSTMSANEENQMSPSNPKKKTNSSALSSASCNDKDMGSLSRNTKKKTKKQKGTANVKKKLESASLDDSNSSSKKYWWDHLVDEKSCNNDKSEYSSNLVLGSKLDKGERKSKTDGSQEEKNDDDDLLDEGAGSVISLCSDDFKFSTTST